MTCPKCGCVMQNLGNVSGIVLLSYPAQWDDLHVCHSCRVRATVRVRGQRPTDLSYLNDYTEIAPEPTKEPT